MRIETVVKANLRTMGSACVALTIMMMTTACRDGGASDASIEVSNQTRDVATTSAPDTRGSVTSVGTDGTGCSSTVEEGSDVRPDWTAGSGVPPLARHILGERARVVAFPFVQRLLVDPPELGPFNKVLLYTSKPTDVVSIVATLGDQTITTVRGTEGSETQSFPGYVDVTGPGCWRVEVSFDDVVDVVFLRFV